MTYWCVDKDNEALRLKSSLLDTKAKLDRYMIKLNWHLKFYEDSYEESGLFLVNSKELYSKYKR